MLVQSVLSLIPVLTAGIMLFMAYCFCIAFVKTEANTLPDLKWLMERTPALDEFFAFMVKTVLVFAALLFAFGQISNHSILSLDIVYLSSIMLLILYHILKEPACLLK